MGIFRVEARHEAGFLKTFKMEAMSKAATETLFKESFPTLEIISISQLDTPPIDNNLKKSISKLKRRSHYKARMCQMRANIQSMTDSEDNLLSHEEIVQLQRLSCKLDRLISQFHTVTLNLKLGGIL